MINKFENIYKEESDAIFRFCLLRVSDREKALDLTQETFLRLWKSMLKGEEILNNKAFLFKIAHRLIIDWYRKKKSFSLESILERREDEEYDILDENTDTESLSTQAEARHLIEKINDLPSYHRTPVYLRYVEDLSPVEIGKILGISANAASVRINRGLKELKEQYEK